MSTGPRGVAPRGPVRVGRSVVRGLTSNVVVDDDGVRTTVADRSARVVERVARSGPLSTADLVEAFDVPDEEIPGFAADLAGLLRSGVLVRAGVGSRHRVRAEAVGGAVVGELRQALGECELFGERKLVVLCCDDHADPELPGELERRSREADVLLVRWGAARCWIGPFVVRGTGHENSGSCPECLTEALRCNGSEATPVEFPVIAATPALTCASLGTVLGVLDGLVAGRTAGWAGRVREIDLRTFDVVDHPVAPCDAPAEPLISASFTHRHVSARTGVMAPVTARRTASGRYLAVTTHPVRSRRSGGSWRRATAFGFGTTPEQASLTCRGEAVERFSTSWRPTPDAVTRTANVLRERGSRVEGVLGSGEPVEFRPLRNPLDDRTLDWWVPAAAVTFGHPETAGARPDSSGCAAGEDIRDAVRRGLAELLERDAVAAWWYRREPRPGVGQELVDDAAGFAVELAAHGRRGWFLDLTGEFGVPVVAAVATRWDGTGTALGFGAASTLRAAAVRAAGEVLQVLGCLEFGDELGVHLPPDWMDERVEDHPYLLPHGLTCVDGPGASDPLPGWIDRLSRGGVDVGYLDLTHPRLGVPVVRVVAPGLSSWYRRARPPAVGENPWDLPV